LTEGEGIVGLFSFLVGQKDAPEATADLTASPSASVPPPDATTPSRMPTPAPPTPFTPPEAWDTAALTAPRPEATGETPNVGPPDPNQIATLQGPIIEALKTVFDPEIPVDIYELGLIYDILVDAERRVLISMTLTSPACPSAQQLPSEVRYKVKAVPGVTDAWVEIVWEPPWDKDRMSDAAKLQLGFL
jgi:FeS assembly SUF system protein